MNTIELLKTDRAVSGQGSQVKRAVFDFIVDGVSLYEGLGRRSDLISTIWIDPPMPKEEQRRAIRRLLTLEPGDLPDGRVSLYVCPECGDIGCGAVSVQIDVKGDSITWSYFGYENTYEHHVERDAYSSVGPFHFSRPAYEVVLDVNLP